VLFSFIDIVDGYPVISPAGVLLGLALVGLGTLYLSYVFMRLSPWLAAIALDEQWAWEENFVWSLDRTEPIKGTIFATAVVYTLATLAWYALAFIPISVGVRTVIDLAVYWLGFVLSIAVLTEIYDMTDAPEAPEGDEVIRVKIMN